MTESTEGKPNRVVLGDGNFLRLVSDDGWEFVQRKTGNNVVVVIAVTDDNQLVLTEQYRPAVDAMVIDLPAGLAGDIPGQETETLETAADRELLEETGYRGSEYTYLSQGPSSPGLCSEVVTFFRAEHIEKVGDGGGDDSEEIEVFLIGLDSIAAWLKDRSRNGAHIAPNVVMALYFVGHQFPDGESFIHRI